jgi:hypothetical protein
MCVQVAQANKKSLPHPFIPLCKVFIKSIVLSKSSTRLAVGLAVTLGTEPHRILQWPRQNVNNLTHILFTTELSYSSPKGNRLLIDPIHKIKTTINYEMF